MHTMIHHLIFNNIANYYLQQDVSSQMYTIQLRMICNPLYMLLNCHSAHLKLRYHNFSALAD